MVRFKLQIISRAALLCWVKTSQLSCYSNFTNCRTILHIKTLRVKLVPITKGQSISKGNFGVFNSSKKTNLKIQIFALAYKGRNVSFVFWKN